MGIIIRLIKVLHCLLYLYYLEAVHLLSSCEIEAKNFRYNKNSQEFCWSYQSRLSIIEHSVYLECHACFIILAVLKLYQGSVCCCSRLDVKVLVDLFKTCRCMFAANGLFFTVAWKFQRKTTATATIKYFRTA